MKGRNLMTKKPEVLSFLIFLLATTPSAAAAQSSSYAEALNHLGLFSGTENGYELSRVPTRAESLVMMLRLWGKEEEALKSTYKKILLMIRGGKAATCRMPMPRV
ncbi:hypothetical protein ACFSQ7_43985 [Paenibacillus rhizoplanae]